MINILTWGCMGMVGSGACWLLLASHVDDKDQVGVPLAACLIAAALPAYACMWLARLVFPLPVVES